MRGVAAPIGVMPLCSWETLGSEHSMGDTWILTLACCSWGVLSTGSMGGVSKGSASACALAAATDATLVASPASPLPFSSTTLSWTPATAARRSRADDIVGSAAPSSSSSSSSARMGSSSVSMSLCSSDEPLLFTGHLLTEAGKLLRLGVPMVAPGLERRRFSSSSDSRLLRQPWRSPPFEYCSSAFKAAMRLSKPRSWRCGHFAIPNLRHIFLKAVVQMPNFRAAVWSGR
mmetsp:Transcript_190/g.521  ORF Transcript_190/g.521 Transcript_190/m.521 type:complete len:231 (+) Transcript_190:287-979(+)